MKVSLNILFLLFLPILSMPVNAMTSTVNLTPPPVLIIDTMPIEKGIFTLQGLTGYKKDLQQTVILEHPNAADDIVHNAMIPGPSVDLITFPSDYPIFDIYYSFDATEPDKPLIESNLITAINDFTISLPFDSSLEFYEVIDYLGNVTFHSTKPVLDNVDSGASNIDLLGDGSVFATFGAGNIVLPPTQFQPHGAVVVTSTPIPAAFWLFLSGFLGLYRTSKKA